MVSIRSWGDGPTKTSAGKKFCPKGVGPTQYPHHFGNGRIIRWSRCMSGFIAGRGGLWPVSSTLAQEILWSTLSPHERMVT